MVYTTVLNYNKENKEAQSSDDDADAEIDSGSKDEDTASPAYLRSSAWGLLGLLSLALLLLAKNNKKNNKKKKNMASLPLIKKGSGTKENNGEAELNPNFVTGYADGESSFTVRIRRSLNSKFGYTFNPCILYSSFPPLCLISSSASPSSQPSHSPPWRSIPFFLSILFYIYYSPLLFFFFSFFDYLHILLYAKKEVNKKR